MKTVSRIPKKSLIALLLGITILASSCIPTGGAKTSYDLLNSERSARGLRHLSWDANAAEKAQEWADHMAARRTISHSSLTSGIEGSWTYLGENVGHAGSSRGVHNGFMGSSSHRASILSSRYTSVGIGVSVRDGHLYVAQVFRG